MPVTSFAIKKNTVRSVSAVSVCTLQSTLVGCRSVLLAYFIRHRSVVCTCIGTKVWAVMQSLRFSYVLSMSCLVAKRSQQVSFDVCNNYICLVYSFILFVPLPLFLSTSFHPFLSLPLSHPPFSWPPSIHPSLYSFNSEHGHLIYWTHLQPKAKYS